MQIKDNKLFSWKWKFDESLEQTTDKFKPKNF